MSDEPRSKRVHYMATGTLQNAPCAPCGKDTLHRAGVCQVCGAGPAKARRGKAANRMPVRG